MSTITSLITNAVVALQAVGVDSPRLDAELLLAHVLHRDRGWLWRYLEYVVSQENAAHFQTLLARRLQREPLAYILGSWEFYGRNFVVNAAVLIPRPETELLVEAILAWARANRVQRIVDIGVGSGVIAVTLKLEAPSLTIMASDLSPAALQVARENARHYDVEDTIQWFQGDLLDPLLTAGVPPVDVIVANLPYVAEKERSELAPEVGNYEPAIALFAPEEGLSCIKRLITQSPALLAPGGLLALEVGWTQAERVCQYLTEQGWQNVRVINDYAGIARHVLGEIGEE